MSSNRTKHEQLIDEQFGGCAFRLSLRGWAIVGCCCIVFCLTITPFWRSIETLEHDDDFRVPYELSKDYWLYARHLDRAVPDVQTDSATHFVIGDSVIWGEYVQADGTLSHFLNQRQPNTRFVNAGINGLFPLALEGLVRHHMPNVRNAPVLLHCNLLWMSSPTADMSATKEQTFNHVGLVPQFQPRIPCYRASFDDRIGTVIRRQMNVFGWVGHLQQCYFEKLDIPSWTLRPDDSSPPHYPNARRLPFSPITLVVPREESYDINRGPDSARHRAWFESGGMTRQSFAWVDPDTSLQWDAFQRLALELKRRDNRVRIVVGPFNEHLVNDESLEGLQNWKQTVATWCRANELDWQVPEPLRSDLYGDASHPLTAGYAALAKAIALD